MTDVNYSPCPMLLCYNDVIVATCHVTGTSNLAVGQTMQLCYVLSHPMLAKRMDLYLGYRSRSITPQLTSTVATNSLPRCDINIT